MEDFKLDTIEEAIEDIRLGKLVIVVDDEDRENEGDLCVLGDFVNPNVINFMATHGRGLICLAITKEQSDKLGLSLMERRNESRYDTAFTQSIEATHGVTTGISASDRSITIKTAINEQNNESKITNYNVDDTKKVIGKVQKTGSKGFYQDDTQLKKRNNISACVNKDYR